MKSTVLPGPVTSIILVVAVICAMFAYVLGRHHGIQEGIKALEAQYAEEDKAAAESVAKLSKELKDQCQAEKEFILNNMCGK